MYAIFLFWCSKIVVNNFSSRSRFLEQKISQVFLFFWYKLLENCGVQVFFSDIGLPFYQANEPIRATLFFFSSLMFLFFSFSSIFSFCFFFSLVQPVNRITLHGLVELLTYLLLQVMSIFAPWNTCSIFQQTTFSSCLTFFTPILFFFLFTKGNWHLEGFYQIRLDMSEICFFLKLLAFKLLSSFALEWDSGGNIFYEGKQK